MSGIGLSLSDGRSAVWPWLGNVRKAGETSEVINQGTGDESVGLHCNQPRRVNRQR